MSCASSATRWWRGSAQYRLVVGPSATSYSRARSVPCLSPHPGTRQKNALPQQANGRGRGGCTPRGKTGSRGHHRLGRTRGLLDREGCSTGAAAATAAGSAPPAPGSAWRCCPAPEWQDGAQARRSRRFRGVGQGRQPAGAAAMDAQARALSGHCGVHRRGDHAPRQRRQLTPWSSSTRSTPAPATTAPPAWATAAACPRTTHASRRWVKSTR